MPSLWLNLSGRFFSAASGTILYPPRWTSLPGSCMADVVKLSDVRRPPVDRRETTFRETAVGSRTARKADP